MNEPKDQNEAACGGSALTAVLGALADQFECHAASRSIDQIEEAGRAMRAAKAEIDVLTYWGPRWEAEHKENERQRIEIETLRRQFAIAKRQWDNWKAEAMRLNERLQKYEPGAPMLLNSTVPNAS